MYLALFLLDKEIQMRKFVVFLLILLTLELASCVVVGRPKKARPVQGVEVIDPEHKAPKSPEPDKHPSPAPKSRF